jgi:hypothetical protein
MAVAHLKSVVDVPAIAGDHDLAPVTLGQHFQITATGLTVSGDPSFETCENLWAALKTLEKSLAFAIGDAIRYFEARFGERASQIIDASGLSDESCRVYRWLAESVPADNRMIDRGLTVKHHLAVARLPPADQARWLRKALHGDGDAQWSAARLKAEVDSNGLEPETAYWVLVRANSKADQERLLKSLHLDGRECKAIERHTPTKGAWGTEPR